MERVLVLTFLFIFALLVTGCNIHQDARSGLSPTVLTASQYDASDIVLVGRVSSLKTVEGDFGQEFLVADVVVIAFIKGKGKAIAQVVVDTNMPHFNFRCCLKERVYIMYLNKSKNFGYLAPSNGKDFLLVED